MAVTARAAARWPKNLVSTPRRSIGTATTASAQEYRNAVLAGPFRSEDDLRELAAEEGISVLQNYRAVFNGHRLRWLAALEIGDDLMMIRHGRAMDAMLWRIGQLTREIAPHAPAIQQNFFMSPDYYMFER